ncbi:MAG: CoA transferase [Bacteroidota bacterium]
MSESAILADLLVVELASVLAGPSVGMFLAELGARVIKVENAKTNGDVTRAWRLPEENSRDDRSAYFCSVNWGKESIALDLTQATDQRLLETLIAKADVVITSFIPGQMQRLGLDWEKWQSLNPRLILAQITGYGPEETRPAFDAVIQAEAGFTFLNGSPDQISKMPVALMDVLTAHQLKEAILLAYIHRLRTGIGKRVQVSLLQSGISSLVNQATNYLVTGHIPQAQGSDHPNIVPYGTLFQTRDAKRVVLAVGTDAQFDRLCRLLGKPTPVAWITNVERVKQRQAVKTWLQALFLEWDQADLLAELQAQQIPAGPVRNLAEVMATPQAQALKLDGSEVAGIKSMAAELGQGTKQEQLKEPPHFDEHGALVRAEFWEK